MNNTLINSLLCLSSHLFWHATLRPAINVRRRQRAKHMHGKRGTLLLSVSCVVIVVVVVESAKPDGHHTHRSGQVDKKKQKRRRQNFEPALTEYRPSATGSLLITKSSPEITSVFVVSGFADV